MYIHPRRVIMMNGDAALFKKMLEVKGCLWHKARPLQQARRRRQGDMSDIDDFLGLACGGYILDAHKIEQSKAIRRLSQKTQVFPDPKCNVHLRTRMTHTLEVASISTVISRILGLNTELALAIALGHDIGHVPFGHIGEKFLREVTGKEFRHEVFACIVAQQIERRGWGLNLTRDTLLGILNHSRGTSELTRSELFDEANVVMYADKIAYCFSDVSDIFHRHYLDINDFPKIAQMVAWFGSGHRGRTSRCIAHLCIESAQKGYVSFQDSEAAINFQALKNAMYGVYPLLNRDAILWPMLRQTYETVSAEIKGVDPAIVIALMTDSEVTAFSHTERRDFKQVVRSFAAAELISNIQGSQIDFTNPDLNW